MIRARSAIETARRMKTIGCKDDDRAEPAGGDDKESHGRSGLTKSVARTLRSNRFVNPHARGRKVEKYMRGTHDRCAFGRRDGWAESVGELDEGRGACEP